eukprot:6756832-Pyramimonas_sp.AAC.1
MVLLEVDDFFIASRAQGNRQWIREVLQSRFRFGKYRDCHAGPVEHAGRRVVFSPQKVHSTKRNTSSRKSAPFPWPGDG